MRIRVARTKAFVSLVLSLSSLSLSFGTVFQATNAITGQVIKFEIEGDKPPTEKELRDIWTEVQRRKTQFDPSKPFEVVEDAPKFVPPSIASLEQTPGRRRDIFDEIAPTWNDTIATATNSRPTGGTIATGGVNWNDFEPQKVTEHGRYFQIMRGASVAFLTGVVVVGILMILRWVYLKNRVETYIHSECNLCGGSIEFPKRGIGETIDCPHCNTKIELRKTGRVKRLLSDLRMRWSQGPRFNWKWACALTASVLVVSGALWGYADIKATAIEQAAKLLEAQEQAASAQKQAASEAQQADFARQELLRQQIVATERATLRQRQDAADLKQKLQEANQLAQDADKNRKQEARRRQEALENADWNRRQEAIGLKQEVEHANRIAEQADWNRQQEALRVKRELEEANRLARDAAWQQQVDDYNRQVNAYNQLQALRAMQNNNPVRPNGVPANARLVRSGNGYVWVW